MTGGEGYAQLGGIKNRTGEIGKTGKTNMKQEKT